MRGILILVSLVSIGCVSEDYHKKEVEILKERITDLYEKCLFIAREYVENETFMAVEQCSATHNYGKEMQKKHDDCKK